MWCRGVGLNDLDGRLRLDLHAVPHIDNWLAVALLVNSVESVVRNILDKDPGHWNRSIDMSARSCSPRERCFAHTLDSQSIWAHRAPQPLNAASTLPRTSRFRNTDGIEEVSSDLVTAVWMFGVHQALHDALGDPLQAAPCAGLNRQRNVLDKVGLDVDDLCLDVVSHVERERKADHRPLTSNDSE